MPEPEATLFGLPVIVSKYVDPGTLVIVGSDGTPLPAEWASMSEIGRALWASKHASSFVVGVGVIERLRG